MFAASLRGSDGLAHRSPTVPPRSKAPTAARAAVCALLALPAAASAVTSSDVTSHVLIGMKPNQGFEVTCEDSVLSFEPVVADELGIMEFSVEGRSSSLPSTVCIQIPAPPSIIEKHTCAASDSSAVICWETDRLATSEVDYGLTEAYGASVSDGDLRMTHEVLIPGLDAETTYHYRAASVDAFGNRTVSPDATFTTMATQPRISDVTLSDITTTTLTVRWTTNRPCSSWVEFGSTSVYGNSTAVQPELVTSHEVTVDGLAPYSLYHLRACGTDEDGRSAASDDQQVMTEAPELVLFDVSVADTTANTATVVWRTTNPATSKVVYGVDESYGKAAGDWDLATEHAVTLAGLEPSTVYHFRASSQDYAGAEIESGDLSFTTEMVPLEITNLRVEDVSDAAVALSWRTSRPSDALVQFGVDESYGWTADGDPVPQLEHTIIVGGLEPCTTYHLRAVSRDTFGYSARSADVVEATEAPDLSVLEIAVADTTATSALIEWRTTAPSLCWIEYGPDVSYGFAGDVSEHPLTEHATVLGDLAPLATYHFRVHATDACGQHTVSDDQLFATPLQDDPGSLAIFGIVATQVGPTFAVICWRTTNDASSTIFYGPTESCSLHEDDHECTNDHCFALTGLQPDSRYYYWVRSENALGAVAESRTYSFRTPLEDIVPPATPQNLRASACESGARLEWQNGGEYDLDRHLVRRRSEGEPDFAVVAYLSGGASGYVDESAVDGWTYEYTVSAVDVVGNESGRTESVWVTAGLDSGGKLWIYPNPVSEEASITFAAPRGEASRYTVSLYDARGRLVRNVARGETSSGIATVRWDARDSTGRTVGSGVYFCVVAFPSESVHAKIMVVR